MTTEHVAPEGLDAPRPAPVAPPAPPLTHIDIRTLPDDALDSLDRYLSQDQRDTLEKARIAGREEKKAAAAKAKEEDAASSRRAKAVVDELVREDAKPESEKAAPGGPPVALSVPPMLTASQLPQAEGYTADFGEIAAEMGMPAEEAQTLLDFVIGGATQTLEGLNTTNREECVTHLKNIYGEANADAIIVGARAGFAKLPEGVQQWLDRTTEDGQILGNHPSVLSMLALWNGGYSKLTPEAAAKELAQHRATKEYMAGDRFKLDKVKLLTMIASRGQEGERELQLPAKPVAPAPNTVQGRINAIRKDPKYSSPDSFVRKPLVAEMNALMAQLHGGE